MTLQSRPNTDGSLAFFGVTFFLLALLVNPTFAIVALIFSILVGTHVAVEMKHIDGFFGTLGFFSILVMLFVLIGAR